MSSSAKTNGRKNGFESISREEQLKLEGAIRRNQDPRANALENAFAMYDLRFINNVRVAQIFRIINVC